MTNGLVNIGFSLPKEDSSSIPSTATSKKLERQYKVIVVDAVSVKPKSMKIRGLRAYGYGCQIKNLLLDTSLLLLCLIGGKDPKLLESARRLNA